MKKIGIMGGTFNPVHNAHLIMAEYAMEEYKLDYVLFMTGGNPPHKKGLDMPDGKVRHEMLVKAIDKDEKFVPCDYEVKKDDYSYSVNTLDYLKKKFPKDELYFIIGGDSLRDFHNWYKPEEILKKCTLLVFPRTSNDKFEDTAENIKKIMGGEIFAIHAPLIGLSSTQIRNRIGEGKSVRHMIPDSVMEYIESNKLYKNQRGESNEI